MAYLTQIRYSQRDFHIRFWVRFVFCSVQGEKERNPFLCQGATRGCWQPKNAQQALFKDPTWINWALTFCAATA